MNTPRKPSRTLKWLFRGAVAVVLITLLMQPWVIYTYRLTIEVSARVVDAQTGEPVRGATVLSVPYKDEMHQWEWLEKHLLYEEMFSEEQKESLRSRYSCGKTNEQGVAAARLHPLHSSTNWQSITSLGEPVPRGFKVAGVVIVADGYVTQWVSSRGMGWDRERGAGENGGSLTRAEFGTIELTRKRALSKK